MLVNPWSPNTWHGTGDPHHKAGKTFVRNHADGIGSLDLFVVPTLSFRMLYGLLIYQHGRRQILWLGVTAHPTTEWMARQLTEACGLERPPRSIVRDRDRVYGQVFTLWLRAMGIRDLPTTPRSPWQNGHTEGLIGSIHGNVLYGVVFGDQAVDKRKRDGSPVSRRRRHGRYLQHAGAADRFTYVSSAGGAPFWNGWRAGPCQALPHSADDRAARIRGRPGLSCPIGPGVSSHAEAGSRAGPPKHRREKRHELLRKKIVETQP